MIPACPQDFWEQVAKRVAQAIIDREINLAGISPARPIAINTPYVTNATTIHEPKTA